MSARYGIEGHWVNKFDVAEIAGKDSPALQYNAESASLHFSVGPPMILQIDDAAELSTLWRQYMIPVRIPFD